MEISIHQVSFINIKEVLYDGFVVRRLTITDESGNSHTLKLFGKDRNSLDFTYLPMIDDRENTSC